MITNILPKNGVINFYPNFLNTTEADFLLEKLKHSLKWQHESIKIFGKEILQPRLTALYGIENKIYTYSGRTMFPLPFTDELLYIKHKIDIFEKENFTTVLCNYYRNGNDSMGWHSDNEKELGKNPLIASLSLGADRKISFKHKNDKNYKIELVLNHGSLLIMKDETQHFWQHAINKSKKIIEPRLNLTFRIII